MTTTTTQATSRPQVDKSLRFASTMMLLRDAPAGLEVFMVQRHRQIEFSSGALVFPGGSLDPNDNVLAETADRLTGAEGLGLETRALRIAAIRETFEESGVLLARPRGAEGTVPAGRVDEIAAAHRLPLAEGQTTFEQILAAEDLVLALDLLVPFAHWITPVNLAKRFDTHFFIAAAPADQVGRHDGHELVDSVWLTPQGAVEANASGRFKVVFPTMRNLIKLGHNRSVEAAMTLARATPVFTVVPDFIIDGSRRTLRIPAEAGYDGTEFDASGEG